MSLICIPLESWIRGGLVSTPEREARARKIMQEAAERALRNWLPKSEQEARPKVTLSSHFYCARTLHYSLNDAPKDPVAPRALDAFALGQTVEAIAVSKCILAGLPVLWPDAEGRQFRDGLDFDGDRLRGSVDMVLEHEGAKIPVEIKSMSEYGFDKSKREGVDDTFGYVGQLQNYIAMMDAPFGLFLGVNKSTGHMFEERVAPDPAKVGVARAAYAAAKKGLPDRPSWAKVRVVRAPGGAVEQIEAVACGYCAHRPTCWPEHKQQIVSGKPTYRKPLEV